MKDIRKWLILDAILTTMIVIAILCYIYYPKNNLPNVRENESSYKNLPSSTMKAIDFPTLSNHLGFKIWEQSIPDLQEKNIVFSPYSISSMLFILCNGSSPITEQEIKNIFGLKGVDIHVLNRAALASHQKILLPFTGMESHLTTSLWLHPNFSPHDIFVQSLQKYYDTSVQILDKNSPEMKINQWVRNSTHNKIEKMVNSITGDMWLLNAVYFKGNWANKFEPLATINSEFYAKDGSTRSCSMMLQSQEVQYLLDPKFHAVGIPYSDGKTYLYIFLPNKIDLSDFYSNLNLTMLQEKLLRFQKNQVLLSIPKFKLECTNNVEEILNKIGVCTKQTNFQHIADGVKLSGVTQKVVFETSEEGVETIPLQHTVEFTANRPFFFMVYNQEQQAILLLGHIVR